MSEFEKFQIKFREGLKNKLLRSVDLNQAGWHSVWTKYQAEGASMLDLVDMAVRVNDFID